LRICARDMSRDQSSDSPGLAPGPMLRSRRNPSAFFGFISRVFFGRPLCVGGGERGDVVREIDRSRARLFDELPSLLSLSYPFPPPPVRACAHRCLSLLTFS
jgi:hypothetical protein